MLLLVIALALPLPALADTSILNVSYDPTRELYQDFNAAFAKYWRWGPSAIPGRDSC